MVNKNGTLNEAPTHWLYAGCFLVKPLESIAHA